MAVCNYGEQFGENGRSFANETSFVIRKFSTTNNPSYSTTNIVRNYDGRLKAVVVLLMKRWEKKIRRWREEDE